MPDGSRPGPSSSPPAGTRARAAARYCLSAAQGSARQAQTRPAPSIAAKAVSRGSQHSVDTFVLRSFTGASSSAAIAPSGAAAWYACASLRSSSSYVAGSRSSHSSAVNISYVERSPRGQAPFGSSTERFVAVAQVSQAQMATAIKRLAAVASDNLGSAKAAALVS